MQTAMDLVQTSHVPPYGYGKTHGWTKIVRMVGRPTLLREVFDSVAWVEAGGGVERKGRNELAQVLRQVVRWHCRLSHVAAHTALFSFDFAGGGDLERVLVRLVVFLVSMPGSAKGGDGGSGVDMEKVTRVVEDMKPEITLLTTKALAADMNAFVTEEDIGILEDVLMDEFRMSGNLTKWPCLSFWDVGVNDSGGGAGSSIMADVSKTLAASLVPDCDASFTECTVNRDKCEQRGDVLCK